MQRCTRGGGIARWVPGRGTTQQDLHIARAQPMTQTGISMAQTGISMAQTGISMARVRYPWPESDIHGQSVRYPWPECQISMTRLVY